MPDGSVVATGSFVDEARFGIGQPEEAVLRSVSDANNDVFVARFAANGTLLWARSAGGALDDSGHAIAALDDGACVVAGLFDGPAVFGAGEPNETVLTGSQGVFLACYEDDGSLRWARRVFLHDGSPGPLSRIVVEGVGEEAVIAGDVNGTAVLIGEGPNAGVAGDGNAGFHLYLARYARDGALRWVRTPDQAGFGGFFTNPFQAIASQDDGSILCGGNIHGGLTLSDGTELPAGPNTRRSVVIHYGPDGEVRLARAFNEGPVLFSQRAVFPQRDGTYVLAGFLFVVDRTLDPGTPQAATLQIAKGNFAVARYRLDGERLFLRQHELAGGILRHVKGLPDGSLALYGSAQRIVLDSATADPRPVGAARELAFLLRITRDGDS